MFPGDASDLPKQQSTPSSICISGNASSYDRPHYHDEDDDDEEEEEEDDIYDDDGVDNSHQLPADHTQLVIGRHPPHVSS